MSDPIDPNAQPEYPATRYQPPPPFAPPAPYGSPPAGPYGASSPYGAAGTYAPPWLQPAPQHPAHAPSNHRRTVLIVLLSLLVVAGGTIGAVVAFGSSSDSSDQLPMPASFDGYYRLSRTNSVESGMRQMISGFGGGSAALKSATFGMYSRNSGDQPELIAFALPSHNVPASSGSNMTSQLQQLGVRMQEFPPGPHGGVSDCGQLNFGTVEEIVCAWTDPSTTGAIVSIIEPVTPDQLNKIERDLRDFID